MKKLVGCVIIMFSLFYLSACSEHTKETSKEINVEHIYFETAEETFEAYKKALMESDYKMLSALTPTITSVKDGEKIWDTIKISKITILEKDIRENKACYSLELDIADGGDSAFETGVFPRWLYLIKGENGWYVDGLMTSGEPEEDWWDGNDTSENTINSFNDEEIENAKKVATEYYQNTVFEINSIEYDLEIPLYNQYLQDYSKELLITFTVYTTKDKDIPRGIVLTRQDINSKWTVLDEGL